MADLSRVVVGLGEIGGLVWDRFRSVLHLTTDAGVSSFDPQSGRSSLIPIAGDLNDLDISPDGQFLLAPEGITEVRGTYPFDLTPGIGFVHRVWLSTGAVEKLSFPHKSFHETGSLDIAFGSDGWALLTTDYGGSGNTPLRRFDGDSASFTPQPVPDVLWVTGGTRLFPSETGRYVFIAEDNISWGPLHIYDAAAGQITASGYLQLLTGYPEFISAKGDVSEAAGLTIITTREHAIVVTDLSLKLVKDLSTDLATASVQGVKFAKGGAELFLWDAASDRILVLDTTTWQQTGVVRLQTSADYDYWSDDGRMELSSDGQLLFIDTRDGFEVVDLAYRQGLYRAGGAGADYIAGTERPDDLHGGAGNDTIAAGEGSNYLRGNEGADFLTGGAGFDDMHGNTGSDTLDGGAGADWVVGGQDEDRLRGGDGDDLVLGNLGADSLTGGAGNDVVRGGQANDSIDGGAGDDWISGDRGDDTIVGGSGADTIHAFWENIAGGAVDRVLDFNAAEGDRVNLLEGTFHFVEQVGADTVVRMGNDQLILVGVQKASLPAGWIFGGF